MTEASGAERAAAILADYEAIGADVRAELAKLTPAEFGQPSGNEGWTAQRVAAHLATSPAAFVFAVRRIGSGRGVPKVPTFVLDALNALGGLRTRRMSVDGMVRAYAEGHQKLAAAIGGTANADWDRTVSTFDQRRTLESFLRDVVLQHEREHLEQLRSRSS